MPQVPDWSGAKTKRSIPTVSEDDRSPDTGEVTERPYEHVPGTTHLNAFIGDVEAKKQAVLQAQGELSAAEERLKQKKIESGMIDG